MAEFYIPVKQRFALMILILLILAGHSFGVVYDKIMSPSEQEEIKMINDILSEAAKKKQVYIENTKLEFDISKLPMIDPNVASKEELSAYGLSSYALNNLEKYRSKGGRINSKEDFLKIYGVDSSIVNAIQDKLILSNKSNSTIKKKNSQNFKNYSSSKPTKDITISDQNYKEHQADNNLVELPLFDPNTATKSELLEQGISVYGANNLLKYRSKGGRIYDTKGLSKIYGIDSTVIKSIESRIRIKEHTNTSAPSFTKTDTLRISKEITIEKTIAEEEPEINQPLNINIATQEELVAIRGIGPVISKGIVEYRNKLGGYHKLEQLLEVYGITDENYDSLIKHLYVEGEIKKFYPAGTTFKNLVRHPYIDYETTKLLKSFSIMNYSEELQKLIDEEKLDKRVLPYIYVSDPEKVIIRD